MTRLLKTSLGGLPCAATVLASGKPNGAGNTARIATPSAKPPALQARRSPAALRVAGIVALGSALALTATAGAAIDWTRTGTSTATLLSALIRTNSSNPPGNETAVAKRLAQFLTGHRISSRLLESSPGR